MGLTPGTRLGPYEVVSPIGAGGMGEVYRARDTRLDREVALKILPDAFAQDPERLARFEREAKTLASLNHPNIAQIYGIEGGTAPALAMEFVSGEDLSQRLMRGPIPLSDTLPIVRQIVEALEAAHDAGIVHRDLKPANIKVRDDGTVKVLDFGLAKMMDPNVGRPEHGGRPEPQAAAGADPSSVRATYDRATYDAPTLTSPMMTAQGIVLGTAAYMAPEQAKGRPVDRRADIWACGCVLFECLTGRRPFPGDSMSETIANILKEQPDWTALPAATPAGVRRLLERCLEKDVRRRLQAIGDARFDLVERADDRPATAAVPPTSRRGSLPTIVAIGALVLAVAGWGLWWRASSRVATTSAVVRLSITPPGRYEMVRQLSQSDANAHWAISADGTQIAFVVQLGATRQLMVRALDRFDARVLPGTENGDFPFWSPDGSAIGFFAGGKMKRVSVNGDAVRTICDCGSLSATWGRGVILLGADGASKNGAAGMSLRLVPDTGGTETPLPKAADASQAPGAWPFFLPDGRHFIYLEMTTVPADRRIMIRSIDEPAARPLVKSPFKARYAASGQVIYMREGVLVAQHLDVDSATLSGPVTPLVEDMLVAEVPGQAQYEASLSGAIAYQARSLAVPSSLLWMTRDGRPGDVVMEPDTFITLDLSSDERLMAFTTGDNSVENEEAPSLVSLFDFTRRLRTRVRLADARSAETPLLSPDGARLVFAAHPKAGQLAEVRAQAANGTGEAEVIARGGNYHPIDWSADGRYLLLHEIGTNLAFGRIALLSLDLQGDRKPVAFVSNDLASAAQGQFSPDGHFVAYSSDLTGRSEIYLQHFPAAGPPTTISAEGGTQPRWRADGRELYFVAGDGAMMAVPVSLGANATVGTPVKLFASGITGENYFFYGGAAMYAPSRDGQRFLVIRSLKAGDPGSIRVVLNAVTRSPAVSSAR